jgi:hypothetical protein
MPRLGSEMEKVREKFSFAQLGLAREVLSFSGPDFRDSYYCHFNEATRVPETFRTRSLEQTESSY